MKKNEIVENLSKELNQDHDSNSNKKIKTALFVLEKVQTYLNDTENYVIGISKNKHLNTGDIMEYVTLKRLGLDTTKRTPRTKGVDIIDKRFKFNEIKTSLNPSNTSFVTLEQLKNGYNMIVATYEGLYKCLSTELLKNISMTSQSKNGYRVKKEWIINSMHSFIKW